MEEEYFARMFEGERKGETGEERKPNLGFDGRRERRETPPYWMETMRSLNEILEKAKEEKY